MKARLRAERRQSPEGDDGQRSPFERDRDAVLHSSAFRRLGGVTQVVDPAEGHVFHNRLTHTLEVAQIAQRLAEHLGRTQGVFAAKHGGIDPSAVEAAALIHDLGHPPFGHVGEKTLNELVVRAGVSDGYEGNAQSFRIVTKLAVRREESPGLNLTRATLNASLKYPWMQSKPPKAPLKKWGAYRSEAQDFRFARAPLGASRHQTLEAQIMDWSDDVAYSVSDTEDFYRAGLIPLGTLASAARSEDSPALEEFMDEAFQRRKEYGIKNRWAEEDMRAAFRELMDALPVEGVYQPSLRARARVRTVTSKLIGTFVQAVRIRPAADKDGNLLEIEPTVLMQVELLKELTWRYVIKGPALAALQHGQKRIIRSLFKTFCSIAFEDRSSKWDVLPIGSRDRLRHLRQSGGSITDEQRVRVAADAVSGMTDRQAVDMCKRLTGVHPGSAFNQILG